MVDVSFGWRLDVDISPEWLFLRLVRIEAECDPNPPLAERVWSVAEQHGVYRLVFELDAGLLLSSYLVGQMILLRKRAHLQGGVLRLCGLSETNREVLHILGLNEQFPNYGSREDAVMGRIS